jgi:uncharacterized protein (TIGR02996 family)
MRSAVAEKAFVAALRNDREDDATRSVYADWLEERGDLPRAEVLRLARVKTKKARVRKLELAAITSSEWRRSVLPPLGVKDAERMPLAEALRRIGLCDHPNAESVREHVEEWVESLGADEGDPYGEVLLYDGDLVIPKGSLETGPSAVAVLGDATIADQFTDLIEADQSLLAVAGNLTCRAIWQLGDSHIAGDVTCDVLYGSSYSSNRTESVGDARVREAIIEHGHHIVIHGKLTAGVRIGDRISVKGKYFKDQGIVTALDPSLLDDDEGLDEAKLYQRICDGKSVLAPSPSPKKRRS